MPPIVLIIFFLCVIKIIPVCIALALSMKLFFMNKRVFWPILAATLVGFFELSLNLMPYFLPSSRGDSDNYIEIICVIRFLSFIFNIIFWGMMATFIYNLAKKVLSKSEVEDNIPLNYERGNLILAFGLMGILYGPFGIAAWAMGYSDLVRMKDSVISIRNRRKVLAGTILGIIGTFIMMFFIVWILYCNMNFIKLLKLYY